MSFREISSTEIQKQVRREIEGIVVRSLRDKARIERGEEPISYAEAAARVIRLLVDSILNNEAFEMDTSEMQEFIAALLHKGITNKW